MQVLKSKLNLLVIALFFACAITADAESISGNVSDGTGSVPLDYVWVRAERTNDPGDTGAVEVDDVGNYTMDVHPENWRVYVEFDGPYDNGYYGHATNGALNIVTPGEYRVMINPGDDVTDYNFEIQVDNTPPTLNEPVLEPSPYKANESIHISVSTSDDSGFRRVRLWMRQKNPYDWFDWDWIRDEDGDGVYEYDIWDWKVTTAGVEYYIEAWDFADNYSSYPADDPRNNPLIIPPEDIDPPDATISGQVLNDVGEPMEGVRIEANREGDGHIRTFTDGDGYYTAEVRVGTWHFHYVESCGYYVTDPPNSDPVFGDGDFHVVAVSEGEEITDINFTMYPDNTPPTIVNQSPEPIIGAGGSNDITFKVEVTDAGAGAWHGHSANIIWRYKGQDGWDEWDMRDGQWGNPRDGVYERNIWIDSGRIMEYYFRAWDRACNDGYDPDPPPPDSPPHIFFVIPGSSMSMDFYGEGIVDEVTVSSTPVQPGDLVTARGEDDDRMVGASYVSTEGHYMLHVYGDDPLTGEGEGLDSDEKIRFYINGVRAVPTDPETGDVVEPTFADMADAVNLNLEASTFEVELAQGWNKFSIQVRPVDTAIEEVLTSIEGQYEIVRTYDAVADPGDPARTYVPDMPEESDLTDIDHKHGYWIKMYDGATLEVDGAGENIESTPIEMAEGWSFISYLLPDPTSVVDTFGIPIGEYLEIVRCYKEGAKTYIPGLDIYNDLETLEPGMGYLVKTDTAGTFVYEGPSFTPTVAAPTVLQSGIHPTPINADFYGDIFIDGEPAPVGTVITAYDPQGVLCSRYTIKKAGRFGFQHVYGDDKTTPIDEGAKRGDVITFYVNGQPAISDEIPIWLADGALIEINLRAHAPFIPKFSMLYQNFPNPFNPETWIPYQLSKDADVTIKIYNVSGRLVQTLELGSKEAGVYLEKEKAGYWDGRNNTGESAASGVYFYSITAGDFTATKKMLVLK